MRVGLNPPLGFVNVTLPVAISFLTFHAISYIVDVYRGRLAPSRSRRRHPALHLVLSPSRRRPDRARARIPAATRLAPTRRRFLARREPAADPRRPVQENGDRQLSRGRARRSRLHRSLAGLAGRSHRRRLRLCDPDLCRFLRLHRHRDRRRRAARLSLSAELQSTLSRAGHRRFLAALAHDAVWPGCATISTSRSAATGTALSPPSAI